MVSVISLIERAIASHAFPAATIEVGSRDRVAWSGAFGRLTYAADAAPVTSATVFDLASLTKVIATTTQALRAVEAGALSLDAPVSAHLPAWRGLDRASVTIADLLEHASGLTAYLPFFRDHRERAEFEEAICSLPLEYTPRTRSIYSDLGFILLGFILDDLGFRLADAVRPDPQASPHGREAAAAGRTAPDTTLLFKPPAGMRIRCAPTELDLWRGRLLQGEVHDENAWVLGGIAGHAGMFGTAAGVGAFAREVLRQPGSAIVERFRQRSTVTNSSRALGWDTMLPTSSCGSRFSPRAIGHTGFTGTSLWIDPERDLYVALLTNRVHPTRENNLIQPVRRAVHDAVVNERDARC